MIKSPYKSYKMKLTVLSPVFIGSGEELNQGQYIFDSDSKILKILDEKKFADFLCEKGLIDDYSDQLIKCGKSINLKNWLDNKKISLNIPVFSSELPCRNLARKDRKTGKLKDVKSLNSVRIFVKNSDKLAYIPGSSIKGAIRTALCSYWVYENKQNLVDVWKGLEFALRNNNKQKFNSIMKQIETKCFKLINYKDEKAEKGDIFSALIVGASVGIDRKKMYISTRLDCAIHKKNSSPMPINLELVKPGTEIFFDLSIGNSVSSYLTIEKIFEALNFYTKQQADNIIYEKNSEYLYSPSKISKDMKPNICLGGMSGYFSKNIVYSLAPTKQDAVNALRQYFAKIYHRHGHLDYDITIAPHTIKAVRDEGNVVPIGWCNLSQEKEKNVSNFTN